MLKSFNLDVMMCYDTSLASKELLFSYDSKIVKQEKFKANKPDLTSTLAFYCRGGILNIFLFMLMNP